MSNSNNDDDTKKKAAQVPRRKAITSLDELGIAPKPSPLHEAKVRDLRHALGDHDENVRDLERAMGMRDEGASDTPGIIVITQPWYKRLLKKLSKTQKILVAMGAIAGAIYSVIELVAWLQAHLK